jgi:hypothetical protein
LLPSVNYLFILNNQRKLNFANENIGILGMAYNIKKDYSGFVVSKD